MKPYNKLTISIPNEFSTDDVQLAQKGIKSFMTLFASVLRNPILSDDGKVFKISWTPSSKALVNEFTVGMTLSVELYDNMPKRKDLVERLIASTRLFN